MTARLLIAVFLVAWFSTGTLVDCSGGGVVQELVHQPGFNEVHTPGSGADPCSLPPGSLEECEFAPSQAVVDLLGPDPNLNRVSYQRSYLPKASGEEPRAILILIPGFLGGASSFDPLARQLVQKFNGQLEVWAVDRRSNQLEDRLGTQAARAAAGVEPPGLPDRDAYAEVVKFYFPEAEGFDVDGDGVIDPTPTLLGPPGEERGVIRMQQDDMRFAAHWGVDTYVRDWRTLVDAARARVGESGLVLFGGHSLGTTWTGVYAAYDFDPGPGVDAGYQSVDGLLLLEGGGLGTGSDTPPTQEEYLARVAELETPGGPSVFSETFFGIDVPSLGAAAELAGLEGDTWPGLPSIMQRTSLLGGFPFSLLLAAPTTADTVVALFIDDDFSPVQIFWTSVGFSDDGPNTFFEPLPPLLPGAFYLAGTAGPDTLRTWKNYQDPSLPVCGLADDPTVSPGCAIIDNGPKPAADEPPQVWGVEREVSNLFDLLRAQYADANFIESYFVGGRTGIDFEFGRDSSSLGDESLLAITQHAQIDIPVFCVGGSNGVAPTEASFASYLSSIATPEADQTVLLLEGYGHLDATLASDHDAVLPLTDWINELLQRKLLETL